MLTLFAAVAVCGGRAQSTALLQPAALAYDAQGNLYIADASRHQVFESTLAGALIVVAGNGTQGFAGDGGAATAAELNAPQGIVLGADGTLYLADTGNQRIRAVTPAGVITTVAGTGAAGFAGDGGPALAASFSRPTALALDGSGGLLVCDTANHRLRRIAAGVVTTVAGTGVQGFAGDGGSAVAAELDSPAGVAVDASGRILVADTRNDRLRAIALDGTITTVAGVGVRGFSGDNAPAAAAQLALPRGVTVTPAGTLLLADADNERLRSIDVSGVIRTVIGTGVQGASADGVPALTALLNTPRAVAVSSFSEPAVTDAPNHQLHVIAADGDSYLPASLAANRISGMTMTAPSPVVYGQASASVSVTGTAATPLGNVQLLENGVPVASANLEAAAASLPLAELPAGSHTLTPVYAGDGLNPAVNGAAMALLVEPAPAVATAAPQTVAYGDPIPALSGSVSGILAQDAGAVSVSFMTSAAALSPPGSYPISAALSGPAAADYALTLGPGSGALLITPAAPSVAAQAPSVSYAGLPMTLSASIATGTQGTPTGTVAFLDGGTSVATSPVKAGAASAVYLAPAAGAHSIVAAYLGDGNFSAANSAAVVSTVMAMPDFSITTASPTQTVIAGSIASWPLTIAAQPGPFTGAVSLSVAGLPAGATASFSPQQVIPGAAAASATLSVVTPAAQVELRPLKDSAPMEALGVLALLAPLWVRRRRRAAMLLVALGTLAAGVTGCGSRVAPAAARATETYSLTVSAVSTNLAGAVVSHTAVVTLTVE